LVSSGFVDVQLIRRDEGMHSVLVARVADEGKTDCEKENLLCLPEE